jgi:putative addiction module component (TIGR02574 family)
MSLDFQSLGIDRLSVPERLQLVDYILAGLPEQVHPDELTEAQWAEIRRRCAEADANPGQGRPWRDVLNDARRKLFNLSGE